VKRKRKEKEKKRGLKRIEKGPHAIIATWSYLSSMTKFF
jgi:hypothetical protein